MASSSDPEARFRRTSLALVVLGSIVLFIAGFAIWAARQLLLTEDWVDTSTEIIEQEVVQEQISAFMVEELFSAVDVQAELEKVLPPRAQVLAGPAASGLRELASRASLRALESPKFQQLWADANRVAHEKLILIVEGGNDRISTEGGIVTLDLRELIADVGAQVGLDVADKLPEQIGEIEILRSDELEAAQDAVDILKKLAYGLVIASLLIYAVAIWLAAGRRRETVRAIGYGWIVVGIAILVAREVAGNAIVDQLSSTAAVEPAIDETWSIGTSLLSASAAAVIGYGIVAVLGATLAGPTSAATSVRRAIAPLFASPLAAYAVLLVLVLLVFIIAPTEGTQRLAPSIVLLILMVAGFEALRRTTVREFPDATWAGAGAAWRERAGGVAHGVSERASGLASRAGERASELRERRRETAVVPTAGDDRIAQLERLQKLRESGLLTDEELASEKARILGETPENREES